MKHYTDISKYNSHKTESEKDKTRVFGEPSLPEENKEGEHTRVFRRQDVTQAAPQKANPASKRRPKLSLRKKLRLNPQLKIKLKKTLESLPKSLPKIKPQEKPVPEQRRHIPRAGKRNPMETSATLYKESEPYVNDQCGKLRFLPAAVFVVFIAALSVWFIFNPKGEYSASEKRYLQQFPETSFETVTSGKFGSEFETYFADQFPARNMWVGFNSYYALGLGNNGANGVYHGSDGYLINVPVPQDNNFLKNIGAVRDFKENLGDTPIAVMLAPSTGYICRDKLPLIHDAYRDDLMLNLGTKELGKSGIPMIDLRKPFKEAYAGGTQLYYRTDHHWTTAGAYVGYTALCKYLDKAPIDRDKLNAEIYPNFYGTTYSTAGFWLSKPDDIEVWSNPGNGGNIKVTITEGTESKEYNTLYFYSHLDEDDKYPVFLDGNHALTTIENSSADRGTIVVVKDSFSHSLAPFLAENYRKVILVDMRYYKQSVSQIVRDEEAEQVLVLYGIDNFSTDTDLVWVS